MITMLGHGSSSFKRHSAQFGYGSNLDTAKVECWVRSSILTHFSNLLILYIVIILHVLFKNCRCQVSLWSKTNPINFKVFPGDIHNSNWVCLNIDQAHHLRVDRVIFPILSIFRSTPIILLMGRMAIQDYLSISHWFALRPHQILGFNTAQSSICFDFSYIKFHVHCTKYCILTLISNIP